MESQVQKIAQYRQQVEQLAQQAASPGAPAGQLLAETRALLDALSADLDLLGPAQPRATALCDGLLQSIQDGLLALDREWRFTYCNEAAAARRSLTPAQVLGKNIWDVVPEMIGTELERRYRAAMESGEVQHFMMPFQSGTWYEISVYPNPDGLVIYWLDKTAEVQARVARDDTAALLNNIVESIPAGIGVIGLPDYRPIFANRAMTAIYPVSEAGVSLFPEAEAVLQAFLDSGAESYEEYFSRIQDGQEQHYRNHLKRITWAGGEALLAVQYDITESEALRRAAETAAEDAQRAAEELNSVFAAMTDGVLVFDVEGNLVRLNPAALQAYGFDPRMRPRHETLDRAAVRRPDGTPLPDEELPSLRALRGEIVTGSRHLQLDAEGRERVILSSSAPVFNAQGEISGAVVAWHDITEEEQGRIGLEQERARLRAVIDQAPEGIVVADEQARVLLTNAVADALYSRPVPYGQEYSTHAELALQYPDGRLYDPRNLPLTRAAIDGETVREVEMQIVWPDGETRALLVNAAPVRAADGSLTGAVGIFQDITARKLEERAGAFLRELVTELGGVDRVEEIGARVVTGLRDFLQCDTCFLSEGTLERQTIEIIAATNLADCPPPEQIADGGLDPVMVNSLAAGQVLQVEDTQTDARTAGVYEKYYAPLGARAVVVVPWIKDGHFTAAINIGASQPRRWQAHEIWLLQAVVDLAMRSIERARLLAALHDRESRLRRLVDSDLMAVFHVDAEGEITQANQVFLRMTGYSSPAGLNWNRLTPTEYAALDRRHRAECARTGAARPYEKEFLRSDGSRVPVLLGYARLEQEPEGYIAFALDLTERRRAERNDRFLAELGQQLLSRTNPETIFTLVSRRLVEHLGAGRCMVNELVGSEIVIHDYHLPGLPDISRLDLKNYPPALLAETRAGRIAYVQDAAADARTREFWEMGLRADGLRAFVLIPRLHDERVALTVNVSQPEPRAWREDEIALISSTADLTWLALERARLLRRVRESEARFRRLSDSNLLGVVFSRLDGQVTSANQLFLALIGYTGQDLADGAVNLKALTPPEYALEDTNAFAQAMERGACPPYEKEFLRKDGARVPVLIGFSPLEDRPDEIVSFVIDISDQRRYQEALRLSEERFRVALEHGGITVFSQDTDLRYDWAYNLHPAFAGVSFLGLNDEEIFPGAGEALTQMKRMVMAERKGRREEIAVEKNGQTYYFDVVGEPLLNSHGEVIGVVGSSVDVSQYRRLSSDLQATQERLDLVMRNTDVCFYTQDANLRYTWIYNPLYGYSADDVLGRTDADLFNAEDAAMLEALKGEVMQTGVMQRREIRVKMRGQPAVFDLTLDPLPGPGGEPGGLAVLAIDMTEQRNLEQEMRLKSSQVEMQRAMLQQRELERMSIARDLHDGPLQEMVAISFGLGEVVNTDDKQSRLERMALVQRTLSDQIHNLRDFCSELRPPALAPFGLEKALRSHVAAFQNKYPSIKVHTNLMRDAKVLPELVRLALFRVSQETLNNTAKHAQATDVWIRFAYDAGMAELEVRDNGRGFVLPDRWIYLAREGHLGLVGMQERVEAVGGELQIQSVIGQGTVTRVTIPLLDNPAVEGKFNL